ncbi:MAG: CAP domain-containing protein [Daejeonella sp.]
MKPASLLVVVISLMLSSTFFEKTALVNSTAGNQSQIKIDSSEFRKEFLTQINEIRAKGCHCGDKYMPPAAALSWNDQLESAAAAHANDMANKKYFNHIGPDKKTVKDRIVEAGYDFSGYRSYAVGENIAFGQRSVKEVMIGWIKSPHHCENLMNPEFKEVGVAESNRYWVQDFGKRVPL